MLSGIKSFLVEKFWTPIVNESVYYNPFNTAVYAFLFGLAALYIVYPVSKRIGISFNREFFLGIAPYIFLGGALRSLKDLNIVETVLLETPLIYILMFIFTAGALFLSRKISEYREIEYYKLFGGIGLTTLLIVLSLYTFSNLAALAYFTGLMVAWAVPFYLILKFLKPELLSYSFVVPVAAHYFDASTTVASLGFGGAEKHVVAQYFINSFGPAGMFLMKTAFIIPITYYILQNVEGEEKNYYLFLIALLGIAIGTRNLVSLLAT